MKERTKSRTNPVKLVEYTVFFNTVSPLNSVNIKATPFSFAAEKGLFTFRDGDGIIATFPVRNVLGVIDKGKVSKKI